MDPYLFKRLWRRPWLSLCSLLLSAIMCLLLGYLVSYRQTQVEQLQQTKEQYDITCVVTDRRGTRSRGLRMGPEVEQILRDESETGLAQYVRELQITKEYTYTAPVLGIVGDWEEELLGVSSAGCDQRLDPERDGAVTYLTEGFYDQSEYLCLVSEQVYHELAGDAIKLYVEDPCVNPSIYDYVGAGMVEVRVAGYYAGTGYTVFISFEASQRLAEELGSWRSSDSVSFLAADNEKLDEIYRLAGNVFGIVDPNATDRNIPKIALTIHDEQYRATIAALEQNIQRTTLLLPLLLLVSLGVGFLVSFLSTRGEKRTYALMRTLGMTRWRLFGSILREQLLLVVLAAAVGVILSGEILTGVGYFLCYAVGCIACIGRAIRVAPTAILREQE